MWIYNPFEIGISGFSGAGKTTLIKKLISTLSDRGLRVGYFKTDAHKFVMDTPGKDTHVAWEAGATGVSIQDPIHGASISRDFDPLLHRLEARNFDRFLVEGRKHSDLPRLLLLDPRFEIDNAIIDEPTILDRVLALIGPADQRERANVLGAEKRLPFFDRDDTQSILEFLDDFWKDSVAPLRGLVLAGGKSRRMGTSKAGLVYKKGMSQTLVMVSLLRKAGLPVVVSVAEESQIPQDVRTYIEEDTQVEVLLDRYPNLGPLSGILSAFDLYRQRGWVVLGCDLPLFSFEDLENLIFQRQYAGYATAYESPVEPGFPEPLAAIYEPKIRSRIFTLFAEGYRCPRKILLQSRVHLVPARSPQALFNANFPHEYEKARLVLSEGVL